MEPVQIEHNNSDAPFMIKFTLPARNLVSNWKQCSLLANYIAEYVGYQYPQQERAENLISTITNELLESIVALVPEQSNLTIRLQQSEQGFQFSADHNIHADIASPYTSFLQALNQTDNKADYFDMLTTENRPDLYFNQLGLLMLTHDFGATLSSNPQDNPDRICTNLFITNKEFKA